MNEKTKLILQDLLQDWQDSSVNDVNSINEQQQKNMDSFLLSNGGSPVLHGVMSEDEEMVENNLMNDSSTSHHVGSSVEETLLNMIKDLKSKQEIIPEINEDNKDNVRIVNLDDSSDDDSWMFVDKEVTENDGQGEQGKNLKEDTFDVDYDGDADCSIYDL